MPTGLFTSDHVDTRELYKEFVRGVEKYVEVNWALISKFVRPTTKEANKIWQRNMEFSEGSEGHVAGFSKPEILEISIPLGDPFQLAYGFTKIALEDSTANELKETQAEALRADQRLLAKRFFYRVMIPGESGASRGFWDSFETKIPPPWKGNSFPTSHTHYLTSGADSIALANINSLKKTIRHHGYAGELYCFVNGGIVEQLENLAGWTTAMTPTSVIETVATEGFKAIKKFHEFTFIEDDWVPDGYLVGVEAVVRPVAMREPVNEQARGLRLFPGPNQDYPLKDAYYERRMDMEVVHRGAGAAMQITSGAWVDPAFTFP